MKVLSILFPLSLFLYILPLSSEPSIIQKNGNPYLSLGSIIQNPIKVERSKSDQSPLQAPKREIESSESKESKVEPEALDSVEKSNRIPGPPSRKLGKMEFLARKYLKDYGKDTLVGALIGGGVSSINNYLNEKDFKNQYKLKGLDSISWLEKNEINSNILQTLHKTKDTLQGLIHVQKGIKEAIEYKFDGDFWKIKNQLKL